MSCRSPRHIPTPQEAVPMAPHSTCPPTPLTSCPRKASHNINVESSDFLIRHGKPQFMPSHVSKNPTAGFLGGGDLTPFGFQHRLSAFLLPKPNSSKCSFPTGVWHYRDLTASSSAGEPPRSKHHEEVTCAWHSLRRCQQRLAPKPPFLLQHLLPILQEKLLKSQAVGRTG